MFGFIGESIAGGWNAITNIASSAVKTITTLPSGFFPAPQRDKVISEIVEPAGGSGMTYRPVKADAESVWETGKMAALSWLNSPYESQYAPVAKAQESQQLAAATSVTQPKTLGQSLSDILKAAKSGLGTVKEIRTVVDEFAEELGIVKRQPADKGIPKAGTPEGRNVYYTNQQQPGGPNVVELAGQIGKYFADQVKGLFSMGYPQMQAQPAQSINGIPLTTWFIIGGLILSLFFLWGRKK